MMTQNNWQDPNQAQEASKYQKPIPSRLLILQTVAELINKAYPTSLDGLATHFDIIQDEDKFFCIDQPPKSNAKRWAT